MQGSAPETALAERNQPSGISRFSRIAALEEFGLVVALVLLALFIGIPHPEFFDPRSLVAVLRQSAFVGIVSFGMVYLIAMVEIDLSVGSTYCMGATAAALLVTIGVNPWIAAALSIILCTALGAINGLLANLMDVPVIIISLGTLSAYRGGALVLSDGRAITGMPRDDAFFATFGSGWLGIPAPVWVLGLSGVALHAVFRHTRFGATVRAIGSNIDAARFIGVNVFAYRIFVTALIGFLCGISGVLALAFFKASDPSLGAGLELQVVAAVVIGGTSLAGGSGTLLGALIGVILISMIGSGLVFYGVSGNWAQFVTGVVIILAIAMDRAIKRKRKAVEQARSAL